MTLRAMGPFNGAMPVPTGIIQGFMRDPANMPYLKYAQLVPAPEVVFSYFRTDPDDVTRLPSINEFAWAYDDYRPTGKAFQLRGETIDSRVQRWDFPYTLGDTTRRLWQRGMNLDPKQMYDDARANHAQLHRAVRVITAMQGAAWAANNTSTPYALLGLASPTYFDDSSGTELLPSGNPNPNYAVILNTFQRVKRRIHLATNGALNGRELVAVLSPSVATALATSGEMREFLRNSVYAKDLTNPNLVNWSLPPTYGGFTLVVEDTVRTFINQKADGTVADVSVSTDKDYILTADTIFFVSRPGGLDGIYGGKSFSTIQIYHYGGEARVEAFSDAKNELTDGHVVMEDKVLVPALQSGFVLTDVLRP